MGVPQARKPLKQAMARCALMMVMVLVLAMLLLTVLAVLLLQLLPLVEGGSCLLPAAGLAVVCLRSLPASHALLPSPTQASLTIHPTARSLCGQGGGLCLLVKDACHIVLLFLC